MTSIADYWKTLPADERREYIAAAREGYDQGILKSDSLIREATLAEAKESAWKEGTEEGRTAAAEEEAARQSTLDETTACRDCGTAVAKRNACHSKNDDGTMAVICSDCDDAEFRRLTGRA